MAKTRRHSDEYGNYGFTWDQMTVTRGFDNYGAKGLFIETDTARLLVYVSEKGNVIRCFPYEGRIKFEDRRK